MDKSVVGSMFDLNRDGKLDTWEKAAEMMFFHNIVMGKSEGERGDTDLDFDDIDIDFDDFD